MQTVKMFQTYSNKNLFTSRDKRELEIGVAFRVFANVHFKERSWLFIFIILLTFF
jgi:hypothetical protein